MKIVTRRRKPEHNQHIKDVQQEDVFLVGGAFHLCFHRDAKGDVQALNLNSLSGWKAWWAADATVDAIFNVVEIVLEAEEPS